MARSPVRFRVQRRHRADTLWTHSPESPSRVASERREPFLPPQFPATIQAARVSYPVFSALSWSEAGMDFSAFCMNVHLRNDQ
jgi:hypothetical protein